MFSYDTMRLLVAYTNESNTCRTPHFTSDLLVALKDDDVSIKRLSFTNGYRANLVVNGSPVTIRAWDATGTFSVRVDDKFVLAMCSRHALAPVSVAGTPLNTLFADRYSEGTRLDDLDEALLEFSFDANDVLWGNVSYLEASPIVDAIHMLIPASSVA